MTSTGTRSETEFTAEVVRITEILPHPGADRLELARFELAGSGPSAYEVVIQKGSARPGDLRAYFSVDCLLPLSHPDFAFLGTRSDGQGKTIYKLRAARLRGVFSQGLLVPAPEGAQFGDQVAERFGVTYYRAPEPEDRGGPTAPTRKPTVQPMPVYGVESLKKVPFLFQPGEPVVVTEKIHGTNFRFGWVRRRVLGIPVGWRFVVGSHRVIKNGQGRDWYGEDLWSQAAQKMGLAEATRAHRGKVFYGELYGHTYSGQRIQDLTYGRAPAAGPGLAVFDVWDDAKRAFLGFWERASLLSALGFEVPPTILRGPGWDERMLEFAEGPSQLDSEQIREGIVVESIEGPRRKAKFVGQGYLLRAAA